MYNKKITLKNYFRSFWIKTKMTEKKESSKELNSWTNKYFINYLCFIFSYKIYSNKNLIVIWSKIPLILSISF